MSVANTVFITVCIISGISILFLFVLYPQLSNILSKYNNGFEKNLQTVFDIILMYKTSKRTKNNNDKNILITRMILYSITFICIILVIILVILT